MEFTLKNKATKKVVEIQGVSMEEYNGDSPVILVYVNGKDDAREVIELPRDPSVSVDDFTTTENEDFILTKKVAK